MDSPKSPPRQNWRTWLGYEDDGAGANETATLFKPGDVVTLRSGGVRMTVRSVKASGIVCLWSDSGRLMIETLPADVLTQAPPSNTPWDR